MSINFKWPSTTTYSSLVTSISLSWKQLIHIFTSLTKLPTVPSSLTDDLAFCSTNLQICWHLSVLTFPVFPHRTQVPAPIQDFPLYSYSGFCSLLQLFSTSLPVYLIIPICRILEFSILKSKPIFFLDPASPMSYLIVTAELSKRVGCLYCLVSHFTFNLYRSQSNVNLDVSLKPLVKVSNDF